MRKKLFAVIMSAMMMITFMPTMAFAAYTPVSDSWGANYDSYTYKENAAATTSKTTTNIAKVLGANGMITAYALDADNVVISSDSYYNLNYMTVLKLGSTPADFTETEYSYDDALALGLLAGASQDAVLKVDLTKEAFLKGTPTISATNEFDFDSVSEWKTRSNCTITGSAKVEMPEYDAASKFTAQEFDLKVVWTGTGTTTVGSIAKKHIKIGAKEKADLGDATFNVDGVAITAEAPSVNTKYYDGAEHKFAMDAVSGLEVTYELKDDSTNVWSVVSGDAVTYKNAGTYNIRAHVKDSKKNTKDVEYIVKVNPATLYFQFDSNDRLNATNTSGVGYYYATNEAKDKRTFAVNKGFDPMTYVSAVSKKTATSDAGKAERKAIKNDAENIAAYLKAFYEVEQTPGKYDSNVINATLNKKDLSGLTTAEKDALIEQCKDYFGNYSTVTLNRANVVDKTKYAIGLNEDIFTFDGADAGKMNELTFVVNQETGINWTKAPLNKVYKSKNGKLAKKKTFKIKAKSASSEKITYKLTKGGSMIKINKTSGKVTVKKGLKKGTYKVNIYAYANYDNGHNSGSDMYTLKVRVK